MGYDKTIDDVTDVLLGARGAVDRVSAASGKGGSLRAEIDKTLEDVRAAGNTYEQGPAQYRNPSI